MVTNSAKTSSLDHLCHGPEDGSDYQTLVGGASIANARGRVAMPSWPPEFDLLRQAYSGRY